MLFTYEQIADLNETELIIYHYVIKNMEKITKMSIRELSQDSYVSTATILRFCRKMGCEGYSEFKLKLKLFNEKTEIPGIDNEMDMIIQFLELSKSKEFKEKIIQAVSCIKNANNISFLGIGTSGVLGKYGARFFSNIGYYSQYIDDPYYPAPINKIEHNVLIALSVSGETKEVIDQLKMYQSKHSTIITITNRPNSTIDKIADISIYYYVQDVVLPHTYNISTQVPVVYILERIARQLALNEELS